MATSVLPSPVFISAIMPRLSTMPPMSCTSKWRMPSARTAASRTTANASGSRSSSDSPLPTRCGTRRSCREVRVGERGRIGLERVDAGDEGLELRSCLPSPRVSSFEGDWP